VGKTVSSKNKEKAGAELRRYPRLKPSEVPSLKSVSFNQGNEVQLIDISKGGMLLETDVRLRPQMEIHLKLVTTTGVIKLEGRVLRSSISSLNGVLWYRSGIAFDEPFELLDSMLEKTAEEEPEAKPEAAPVIATPAIPMPAVTPSAVTTPAIAMPAVTPPAATTPEHIGQLPLRPPAGLEFDGTSAFLTIFANDTSVMSLSDMLKLNDW
jgi:hypothetical protein